MKIEHKIQLKPYNTFGLAAIAENFLAARTLTDLKEGISLAKKNNWPITLIGGGSNMLIKSDIKGLVIKLESKGIKTLEEDENHILIKVEAGENWHDFVLYTVRKAYGGLENLSLIPGNVGTVPVQNIGAYGVEIKDNLVSLNALNLQTLEVETFTNEEAKFGYRESIFKNELKGQYIILSCIFKLTKSNHVLHIDYGNIKQQLEVNHIHNPTIGDISRAVIQIRRSKLPDPKEIGNSGSFFKNPVISKTHFDELKENFPDIQGYQIGDYVKIPAGWLIEKAGWKGFRKGDAGVHINQALVLVNYGNANGQHILDLAHKIQHDIFQKFGINIEMEVNIIS